MRAESLISVTDIAGILRDRNDPATLIPVIRTADAPGLIADGTISGGMIPKVECCINAIRWGVTNRVFIIDGRIPHAILIEMLTNEGIGDHVYGRAPHPDGRKENCNATGYPSAGQAVYRRHLPPLPCGAQAREGIPGL